VDAAAGLAGLHCAFSSNTLIKQSTVYLTAGGLYSKGLHKIRQNRIKSDEIVLTFAAASQNDQLLLNSPRTGR
jgi:hypothetical protein